jgi:predicted deacylase
MSLAKKTIDQWGESHVPLGERKRFRLETSTSFTGTSIKLPLMVWRGPHEGPVLAITAAIHGDEINGTGAIQNIVKNRPFELARGSLILVPVVNTLAFERHSRYMPDRRDLNRCFPGSKKGSLSGRLGSLVYEEIVSRSDYIIDLHTAAVRRTNFPHVRADMSNPECQRLAKAFGTEIVLDGVGPTGSFRFEASAANCPTITLEAGEVFKVEPSVQEVTIRGIMRVLAELNMIESEAGVHEEPLNQVVVEDTHWTRANFGGFLEFHVAPGEMVKKGQAVATNTGLLGKEHEVIKSLYDGIVLGMSTMPAVEPGDPVVHIARLDTQRKVLKFGETVDNLEAGDLETHLRDDLATNISVVEFTEDYH